MILTLKELANHLRVNERTILRMQKSGQIKGIKVGGQWRFNGSQIDALFFPGSPVSDGSAAVPLSEFSPDRSGVPLSRLLRENRIIAEMEATTAEEAVDELMGPVVSGNLCLEPRQLRRAILDREKMLSTGVGNGIAIPHPRNPVTTLAEPAVVVAGRSSKGIDFGAVDGKPVFVFFLIASQTVQTHLHILGCLARICSSSDAVTDLKAAPDSEKIMRALLIAERDSFLQSSGHH